MCLSRVIKKFKKNDDMVEAFKIYQRSSYSDYDYSDRFRMNLRRKGIHYKARGRKLTDTSKHSTYDAGFHCYENLKEALHALNNNIIYRHCCICRVLIWDIRAIGFDTGSIVVSKNLRIIEEIK